MKLFKTFKLRIETFGDIKESIVDALFLAREYGVDVVIEHNVDVTVTPVASYVTCYKLFEELIRKLQGKKKPVCTHCGSSDIKADAFAVWNIKKQRWDVAAVMDNGHSCEACRGECNFKWVDAYPAPPTTATNDSIGETTMKKYFEISTHLEENGFQATGRFDLEPDVEFVEHYLRTEDGVSVLLHKRGENADLFVPSASNGTDDAPDLALLTSSTALPAK